MIILEWLTTYLETSKMDMTIEIELFGWLAILIIFGVCLGVKILIFVIAEYIKKKRRKKDDNT